MYKYKTMHKVDIVSFGAVSIGKKLKKQEKVLEKWTKKLREAFEQDTSVRQRANLRIKIDNAAERRNKYLKKLKIAEEMKSELMAEHAREVNSK